MENLIIPSWFVWVIGAIITLFIPWAIWITRASFNNDKAIALNTANSQKVNEDLQNIYDLIDESKTSTKERFDKLEVKLDTFLHQEMTLLKNIISK